MGIRETMSAPVFTIGMSRNGTTITDKLLRMSADVHPDRYAPFDRWDFAAMMEAGGDVGDKHTLRRMGGWIEQSPPGYKYVAIKLALPWAYESFGWPRLVSMFPGARFVLVLRDSYAAWQSWSKMPHVQEIGVNVIQEVYRVWHDRMAALYAEFVARFPDRAVLITFENLVRGADGTMKPVWKMLGVEPPENLQAQMRKPEHWIGEPIA